MTEDAVSYDLTDGVATVTLDRPEVRNALSAAMAEELLAAVDSAVDDEARCLLIQGTGAAFCAGGDVEAMLEAIEDDVPPARRVEYVTRSVTRAVRRVHDCRIPTVAAIDGPAFGAGGALLLACDLQLGHPDAKVSFGFRRVGLPVDAGVSYLLPRVVGLNRAKELVYTGELVDADRARELGLLTRVFEADSFEAGVANVVETVASGPTVALSASKRLLDADHGSFEAATRAEATASEAAFGTTDHEEGARAFREGREPEFVGE